MATRKERDNRQERSTGDLQLDGIALDLEDNQVVGKNGRQHLTPKLTDLLETFMRSPGKVLTRRHLMKKVWETDYLGDTRTLNVHIRWLRERIEEDPSSPRYLRTVRGVGYRFDVPE